jgi:hypothetical protein
MNTNNQQIDWQNDKEISIEPKPNDKETCDKPLLNILKSGKIFKKQYYDEYKRRYKNSPFGRCHFDGKYHKELTSEIIKNTDLNLAKLVFFSEKDVEPNQELDLANCGELIKFRNFDDDSHFVIHEFHGHTTPIHIKKNGEIIIHDFQLLPYEVAKKGVSLDTYFITVIASNDNTKIGLIHVICKDGLLHGVECKEMIRTMNTVKFENRDNETLQFKFKDLMN